VAKSDCTKGTLVSENTAATLPVAVAAVTAPASRGVTNEHSATFTILISLSLCHFLNDMNQSLVPAVYPILKQSYQLDFGQIGLITLAFQLTASLLQPVVGMVTDKRPTPFSLPVAMGCGLFGLLLLSVAGSYPMILIAAAMVGLGSSVFHPESSRVARMASGGRYGFAQSVFQLGGSSGSAIGPLLAAFIVVPRGQGSIAWFSAAALLAIVVLANVSAWYSRHPAMVARRGRRAPAAIPAPPAARQGDRGNGGNPDSAVLQERLYVQPELVLHVLPDREISCLGPKRTVHAVRLSWRRRRRHLRRRPDRRPLGPQADDLVLDPGRVSLRPDAAVRGPDVDGHPERRDRHNSRVSLFRHHRLCAGASAPAALAW
jgi:hypothetical protein